MKSKSITTIDDSDFTLSPERTKLVKKEFRETDDVRRQALDTLRDWANKNPRLIKLRLDSTWLLKFLRWKKFSIPMAQELIERYLVLRYYNHDGVLLFRNLDYYDIAVQELLDAGFIFALPKRDSHGRRVLFYRLKALDPTKHCNYDIVRIFGVIFESLMEDIDSQINGFVHVIDSTGFGLNYLTLFTPSDAVRIGKNMEKVLPMRHKEIHGLKIHPSVKFVVDFALSKMSSKMKKRVLLHKDTKSVKKFLSEDNLPEEYGGKLKLEAIISSFKKELEDKRDLVMLNDEMRVNLDAYPSNVRNGSIKSLKTTINELTEGRNKSKFFENIQGSFKKLEID